ncbi:uncharacterized protein RBU33_022306 isoform 1-T2 [Hipposideros larvatus]
METEFWPPLLILKVKVTSRTRVQGGKATEQNCGEVPTSKLGELMGSLVGAPSAACLPSALGTGIRSQCHSMSSAPHKGDLKKHPQHGVWREVNTGPDRQSCGSVKRGTGDNRVVKSGRPGLLELYQPHVLKGEKTEAYTNGSGTSPG